MPTLRSINTVIRQYVTCLYITSSHIFALQTSFWFVITAYIICIIVFCKRIASIFINGKFYVVFFVCVYVFFSRFVYQMLPLFICLLKIKWIDSEFCDGSLAVCIEWKFFFVLIDWMKWGYFAIIDSILFFRRHSDLLINSFFLVLSQNIIDRYLLSLVCCYFSIFLLKTFDMIVYNKKTGILKRKCQTHCNQQTCSFR